MKNYLEDEGNMEAYALRLMRKRKAQGKCTMCATKLVDGRCPSCRKRPDSVRP